MMVSTNQHQCRKNKLLYWSWRLFSVLIFHLLKIRNSLVFYFFVSHTQTRSKIAVVLFLRLRADGPKDECGELSIDPVSIVLRFLSVCVTFSEKILPRASVSLSLGVRQEGKYSLKFFSESFPRTWVQQENMLKVSFVTNVWKLVRVMFDERSYPVWTIYIHAV